jgi:hypothetical protein
MNWVSFWEALRDDFAELTLPYAFSWSLAQAFALLFHHADAEFWHGLVQRAVGV